MKKGFWFRRWWSRENTQEESKLWGPLK